MQFGGKITEEELQKLSKSKNWINGSFKNLELTTLNPSLSQFPKMIYKMIKGIKGGDPKQKLPIVPFNQASFLSPSDEPKFIWYGHSVVLLNIGGKLILIDPMLGPNASPIAPMPTKRFSENTLDIIDDLPELDYVLISHDHYDHLDLASIKRLKGKVKQFVVALGVKKHLVHWGIDKNKVTEMDWWDCVKTDGLSFHFTPTRHFAGRGLKDRNKSLWGGWVIETEKHKIWFSGDGGYGDHFKEVGVNLGPFDFAFMECGQYSVDWHLIHMFPQESVQAAIDAKAKKVMPVHWGGFRLSYQHTWTQPAEEFIATAEQHNLPCITPQLGEEVNLNTTSTSNWWEHYL